MKRALLGALAAVPLLAVTLLALPLQAQPISNLDLDIGRARALVESGNGAAGRVLLDSLVQRAPMGTATLGELLYWRGLLSESGATAERDWRRLLLEVPMSPRAEDALLRLAQLSLLRGHPDDARALLERMVRDYADPSSQARAHFWLAKALFDENDRPRGCGALDIASRSAPTNAVELRTQLDDLQARCRGVTAVAPIAEVATAASAASSADTMSTAARAAAELPPPVVAAPTTASAPPRDSVRAAPTAPPARTPATRTTPDTRAEPTASSSASAASASGIPAGARFSVQLAAYQRLDQAEDMVRRLAARNVEARVDGTVAPFRVRTGYYRTRAAAAARLAEFTREGQDGFIAELTP